MCLNKIMYVRFLYRLNFLVIYIRYRALTDCYVFDILLLASERTSSKTRVARRPLTKMWYIIRGKVCRLSHERSVIRVVSPQELRRAQGRTFCTGLGRSERNPVYCSGGGCRFDEINRLRFGTYKPRSSCHGCLPQQDKGDLRSEQW